MFKNSQTLYMPYRFEVAVLISVYVASSVAFHTTTYNHSTFMHASLELVFEFFKPLT